MKNKEQIMHSFQRLEDLMQTVTASHAKNRQEHVIVLGLRKLRNIFNRVISIVEKHKQATHEQISNLKGLLASSIKITEALLSQIKRLNTISDPMQLVQHTLVQILKPQTALLSEL